MVWLAPPVFVWEDALPPVAVPLELFEEVDNGFAARLTVITYCEVAFLSAEVTVAMIIVSVPALYSVLRLILTVPRSPAVAANSTEVTSYSTSIL